MHDLRAFLKSEVFSLGQWARAGFAKGGLESSASLWRNDSPGASLAAPNPEVSALTPGAWKPAHNAGSHISTAMTAAGPC